ncbi:hypothetical protein C1H46_021929 [Malus baccata]|uniref:tRNA (guanine(46)-N(7))-methyltransferase n=1 Tax=Malus baccata TaxID=106549 RepID=A0A540M192_MALBA|nr:hypothetical protein C1H46_021928 [Malus baccata]TQD92515.1 hypothetical protein C1H46_021929 [Malus baccata]
MSGKETNPTFSKSTGLPRKRFYRARAHCNPLSDSHFPVPVSPRHVDYSLHYQQYLPSSDQVDSCKKVQFADIGCGFGGLLIRLSTLFPETLMIGMELRDKVTEYVKESILAFRVTDPGQYQNISVVRTNSISSYEALESATEEGQKVDRNGGQTFRALYRRIAPSL